MNASDTSHALGPDLALLAPPSFALRPSAQGLVGAETGTGAALSVLLKPTAAGSLSPERLIESALALMQKKHPGAQRVGATEPVSIDGCSGRVALLQVNVPGTTPIHIVLTAMIVPDPANAAQQRNLILVLEVPAAAFEQRREYYLRFAQAQLRIGAARSAQTTPWVLELAPMAPPAEPEPAVAPATPVRAIPEPAPQPIRPQTRKPAPAAAPAAVATDNQDASLAAAAQGQRTLAISILLSFIARAIGNVPDVPVLLAYAISAAVLIYAISGVLKICSGFAYSMNAKLVVMFCSSVPLLGIFTWVYLSIKTTRRLRAAGYQVGLFGARA
ncbi:MAG TPA: hypothetical protein VN259_00210 [Xanthomonadales bacterium]|nr:hypothetical protein [Xanthomonadales bacterium]